MIVSNQNWHSVECHLSECNLTSFQFNTLCHNDYVTMLIVTLLNVILQNIVAPQKDGTGSSVLFYANKLERLYLTSIPLSLLLQGR